VLLSRILPTIIVVEMFIAGIPYACIGKWGSAVYWWAAALLNFAVIYIIPKVG
jgi:hypothetical protein